jgi:hypothetical protein
MRADSYTTGFLSQLARTVVNTNFASVGCVEFQHFSLRQEGDVYRRAGSISRQVLIEALNKSSPDCVKPYL